MASTSVLDRKVQVLLKLRNYELLEKEETKEGDFLTLSSPDGKKLLLWPVRDVETVGIRYVNLLSKKVEAKGLDGGIMISSGKYTYASRANSRKRRVELIPLNFPSFNIFTHSLVPKHEVLTPEEKKEVLQKYRVEPYQLPLLRASDPVAKVIGAKPGDLVKIVRRSPTAGEYVSYRYVAEG